MGTSSSHGGNKDKKGLLPNDYVKPIVSWQDTKTGFSKYINGNGGSIKKTASNYIKSSGGAGQLFSCNTKSGFSVLQSSLVLRALGKASQRRLGEPMSSYLLLGREILMSPLLFLQGFSQCSFVTLGQGHSASESTAAAGACLT